MYVPVITVVSCKAYYPIWPWFLSKYPFLNVLDVLSAELFNLALFNLSKPTANTPHNTKCICASQYASCWV